MAKIQLVNIKKTYGKAPKTVNVIHDMSITIDDGEFIVVVGPSGCGKSTLLRMIAGLEEISAGQLILGERIVNQDEPKDRDIAMVFQNYALYPHMSVYENMAYGLKIRGIDKKNIDMRVQKVAKILELHPFLQRTPRQLSGGQRQRVAMGRAIVREPAVFLFDEPLSNLDAKLRVQMRLEIQKLHQTLGTTSLYVTHDQVEAMTLGQRMIVMNAGQIEQIGKPAEIYAQPATTFVASFIGAPPMNLLHGYRTAGYFTPTHATAIALPSGIFPHSDQHCILGIRPEQLVFGQPGFTMRTELVESLGAELLIHACLGNQSIVMRVPATTNVRTGQEITAGFNPAHLHWFNPQTAQRLM